MKVPEHLGANIKYYITTQELVLSTSYYVSGNFKNQVNTGNSRIVVRDSRIKNRQFSKIILNFVRSTATPIASPYNYKVFKQFICVIAVVNHSRMYLIVFWNFETFNKANLSI